MRYFLFAGLAAAVFLAAAPAFPATVTLKSGSTIEGKIISRSGKSLIIDYNGSPIRYSLDEVAGIKEDEEASLEPASSVSTDTLPVSPSGPRQPSPEVPEASGGQDSGQKQQPSSADSGTAAALEAINKRYYNLERLGLRGFRCEVSCDVIEQIRAVLNEKFPGEPKTEAVNALKIYAEWTDGKLTVESSPLSPSGDGQFDTSMKQIISGITGSLNGFFQTWRGFVLEPMFYSADCSISRDAHGEKITVNGKTHSAVSLFDSDSLLKSVDISMGGNRLTILPHFVKEKGAFLIDGMENDLNDLEKIKSRVEYQDVEGFQLPKSVTLSNSSPGTRQDFKFTFLNYTLRKAE